VRAAGNGFDVTAQGRRQLPFILRQRRQRPGM